nr:hypothetical protein [Candidatus Sigynarchaeota archaeon]
TVENMEFVGGNNFIIAIWECKEEDMWAAQLLAAWLDDVFTLETYPIIPMEQHTKAWDLYKKATSVVKK